MTVDAAWQAALATEYAAVFGYGTLGPKLTEAVDIALARRSQEEHRELRDATAAALAAAGRQPDAPQADYQPPFPVTSPVDAQRYALRLEVDCAAAWRYLVATAASGSAPDGLRRDAGVALTASAVRGTRWRRRLRPAQPTVAFPGT
jgi:Domain of unknown function (DUF4439)